MNPQHTVPVLDDGGVIIVDSAVICGYLVDKYGKDDKLYPKDLVKRSHVNTRLFYNGCNVFSRLRFLIEPVFFDKWAKLDEWRLRYIEKLWKVVDRFVSETPYLCGNDITIADFCLVSTISSVDQIVRIDPVAYPNLIRWMDRLRQLPYYQEKNGVGAAQLQKFVVEAVEKNASACN